VNDNEDQNSDSKWFENQLVQAVKKYFLKYFLRILNHQINDAYFWAFKVFYIELNRVGLFSLNNIQTVILMAKSVTYTILSYNF